MDIRELYDKIGGDLDDLLRRFGNEARVERFLGLFLKDTSFAELQEAVEKEDWPVAFRAAHTLKGVAGNMSFSKLLRSVSELTEALRGGEALTDWALYWAVSDDFALVTENVRAYLEEKA